MKLFNVISIVALMGSAPFFNLSDLKLGPVESNVTAFEADAQLARPVSLDATQTVEGETKVQVISLN